MRENGFTLSIPKTTHPVPHKQSLQQESICQDQWWLYLRFQESQVPGREFQSPKGGPIYRRTTTRGTLLAPSTSSRPSARSPGLTPQRSSSVWCGAWCARDWPTAWRPCRTSPTRAWPVSPGLRYTDCGQPSGYRGLRPTVWWEAGVLPLGQKFWGSTSSLVQPSTSSAVRQCPTQQCRK